MAAFTSKADGNWNAAGQTTWNEVGTPGDGDTVTISHNITITANLTIGSSPATGGTPAILWGSVTGKALTLNDGLTMTIKGDFRWNNSSDSNVNDFTIGAGCTVSLLPPSGQQYFYDFQTNDKNGRIIINGTSGSRTLFETDKSSSGLSGCMKVTGYKVQGITTATYTDFEDFGTTTVYGLRVYRIRGGVNLADALTHCTITNCTFTRCNMKFDLGGGAWDGNITFQSNKFVSSISISEAGGVVADTCLTLIVNDSGTSGVRLWDSNAIDKQVYFAPYKARSSGGAWSNNFHGDTVLFLSSSTWVTGNFTDNAIYGAINDLNIYGPSEGNWWLTTNADPHFIAPQGTNTVVSDDMFEIANASAVGSGDCVFPDNDSTTCTITGCIVLPSSNGQTAGKLVSNLQASGPAVTVNHNTYCATGGEAGLVHTDETASSYAGMLASVRSNLVWAAAAETKCLAIFASGGGTPAVDAVTVARYNGFWNPATGTCVYNSVTSQADVTGYSGIKISPNTTYPNATVGNNDVTVSSDPFLDRTRNFAKWGQVNAGTDGSYGQARTAMLATPSLLPSAIEWTRNGWQVTSTDLKDAGHDAATIGAMGFAAAPGGNRRRQLICGASA